MAERVTDIPVAGTLISSPDITPSELQLAVRNHSMPLEALRYPITPIGLHYLLIHFDIPAVDPSAWTLTVGGRVRHPLNLSLEEMQRRPAMTIPGTLECDGNSRARLPRRPSKVCRCDCSVPVGTAWPTSSGCEGSRCSEDRPMAASRLLRTTTAAPTTIRASPSLVCCRER